MTKTLTLTAVTGVLLLGLSACADAPAEEAAPAAETTVTGETAVPAEVILAADDAPAGFTHTDLGATLAAGDPEANAELLAMMAELTGATVTAPAHCAGLLPTAVDILTHIGQDPATTAGTDFTDAEGTAITAMATTDAGLTRAPGDLSDCATFTRESAVEGVDLTLTYHAQPMDLELPGADAVTAARVQLADDAVVEESTVIAGDVDGVYFYLTAPATLDDQVLIDLAGAQVEKIAGR